MSEPFLSRTHKNIHIVIWQEGNKHCSVFFNIQPFSHPFSCGNEREINENKIK